MDKQAIRIRALIEDIVTACDFVTMAALEAGLDEQNAHHCRLAVDEVCTNIIEHGYDTEKSGGMIDIVCRHQTMHFFIEIFDDGIPFNPLLRADPDPGLSLDERPLGGWGIFFVKKMMDEVHYDRVQERNHLVMIKNLNRSASLNENQGMAERKAAIAAESHQNRVRSLAPRGHLGYDESRDLEAAIARELDAGHKDLVIDMGQVDYISSSGLKVLVSMWRRAHDMRGDLVLAALTPTVHETLTLIGFDLVFAVFRSVEEAVAKHSFSRK